MKPGFEPANQLGIGDFVRRIAVGDVKRIGHSLALGSHFGHVNIEAELGEVYA